MSAPLRRSLLSLHNSYRNFLNQGVIKDCRSLKRSLHACQNLCSQQWQLWSAVCLQRTPVITQDASSMEAQFGALLDKMEYEFSHLSDHELRHKEDLRAAERRRQEDYEESEAEAIRQTALEAEDAWEAELHSFTPGNRTTEADEMKDVKSTRRMLDKKLVLLVKQKLGDQTHWVMPQGSRQDGESMRQAAERTLSELCGPSIKATFLGNAPCGFLKYKYPSSASIGYTGAKVFFFKAHLQGGEVVPSSESLTDYQWVSTEEISNLVSPQYKKQVSKFMLDF